jgi:NTP pyrophosphatase (non-canonical NTP hydrolase)
MCDYGSNGYWAHRMEEPLNNAPEPGETLENPNWELNFMDYQAQARQTAKYPTQYAILYPLLGLAGEVGEFCNKYKKVLRDGAEFDVEDMSSELGDVLWYLSQVAYDAGIDFSYVANKNLDKLFDRMNRGVIGGSGDNR